MEQLITEKKKIRGFGRVQIEEDGRIVGDSGWMKNNVTNAGMDLYILQLMSADAGSLRVSWVALGTGGTVNDTSTGLPGELNHHASGRASATLATSASSRLRVTATFNSTRTFVTTSANISNIGLFQASVTDVGTIFAGFTYASSQVTTNQNVNVTYDIDFTG
jgi:hypothetical protein